jgi:oxepin-CoA hydrolase/3-oxo-5,6-dehydrosuberyl-CoA semialdehyde dehydrogenase
MTPVVESFVVDRWVAGEGERRELRDAATGEPVATVPAAGPDAAAMLDHARRVGGPALRALTFHDRGAILKEVALHLNERRDELYELSHHTGATKYDARFDVDGGIGVLFSYSGKGRRDFPAGDVVLDGPAEPLGKGGTFVGRHVYVPRLGVAVQINAFNFPVWGMLEKLAPAFLAGLPTIVKPASVTSFVTAAAVRQLLEAELPAGTLQLYVGDPARLLDQLDAQDQVAFTGSAATGAKLRAHRAVLERGVRLTTEADSLNAAILGPDAVPGIPEFDLWVKSLVTEMTVKAGQKCTAIRRAFVPRDRLRDATDAVAERFAKIVVGDPRDPATRMGALVSLEHREVVRDALGQLARDGAEPVLGDPSHVDTATADPERGAFLPPLLLRADDPDAAAPHRVEAFGPVATLMPYDGTADVVDLVARGAGSLVASVASHDVGFVRDVVLGLAPHHGRILVLDRDDAEEQTGHGSPLPTLVHGGPGRAGGSEELGGVRSVLHHMQRVALQGSPRAVTAITGAWTQGAPAGDEATHPFRKHLDELRVGDRVVGGPRTITDDDVAHFADFTGDRFYAHTDDGAAAANPFFGRRVAHGYLVLAFAAGLFVDPGPGPVLANYGLDNLRFLAPTFIDDQITVTLTAKEITPRHGHPYGEVRWDTVVTNQDGTVVATYDVLTLVARREA